MLSDKIWVTRKARIFAEKRLRQNSILSIAFIIWYSFLLVCLAIWNIIYNIQRLDILLIFGSIAIFVTSIFITSQKFIERSHIMRNCYIRLDELYEKVKRAEDAAKYELIQQYESEYATLLSNVENHTDYDYLCLRCSLRNNKNTTFIPFTWLDWMRYLWEKSWRAMFIFSIFILPIFLLKVI